MDDSCGPATVERVKRRKREWSWPAAGGGRKSKFYVRVEKCRDDSITGGATNPFRVGRPAIFPLTRVAVKTVLPPPTLLLLLLLRPLLLPLRWTVTAVRLRSGQRRGENTCGVCGRRFGTTGVASSPSVSTDGGQYTVARESRACGVRRLSCVETSVRARAMGYGGEKGPRAAGRAKLGERPPRDAIRQCHLTSNAHVTGRARGFADTLIFRVRPLYCVARRRTI